MDSPIAQLESPGGEWGPRCGGRVLPGFTAVGRTRVSSRSVIQVCLSGSVRSIVYVLAEISCFCEVTRVLNWLKPNFDFFQTNLLPLRTNQTEIRGGVVG